MQNRRGGWHWTDAIATAAPSVRDRVTSFRRTRHSAAFLWFIALQLVALFAFVRYFFRWTWDQHVSASWRLLRASSGLLLCFGEYLFHRYLETVRFLRAFCTSHLDHKLTAIGLIPRIRSATFALDSRLRGVHALLRAVRILIPGNPDLRADETLGLELPDDGSQQSMWVAEPHPTLGLLRLWCRRGDGAAKFGRPATGRALRVRAVFLQVDLGPAGVVGHPGDRAHGPRLQSTSSASESISSTATCSTSRP